MELGYYKNIAYIKSAKDRDDYLNLANLIEESKKARTNESKIAILLKLVDKFEIEQRREQIKAIFAGYKGGILDAEQQGIIDFYFGRKEPSFSKTAEEFLEQPSSPESSKPLDARAINDFIDFFRQT